MELLAPAGTLDVFETAVDSGADAIYIGAPAVNARALAKSFSLEDIAAMVYHAHSNDVKVYIAMNSLIKDDDFSSVVQLLSIFSGIGVDALIIQDLGLYQIARRFFPELRLHASTLMGANNSANVRQFTEMGYERIVLAREMRIDEIKQLRMSTEAELEVFVHGAMCFAYSGLCLFSSFLGGKSGLRGRCVQPCRRRYTWQGSGKKSGGYLFSMNDLVGIDLVKELQDAGINSLKIEGRMRNRQYVGKVVQAYRMVIDNPDSQNVLQEAHDLLDQAMGRKTTAGYFIESNDNDLIAHRHSGNTGIFVGKVLRIKEGKGLLDSSVSIATGDRLRLHHEKSGERTAFTVKDQFEDYFDKKILLTLPSDAVIGDSLYKIDTSESRSKAAKAGQIVPSDFKKVIQKEKKRERIGKIKRLLVDNVKGRDQQYVKNLQRKIVKKDYRDKTKADSFRALPLWLKLDDLNHLRYMPTVFTPERLVIQATKETLRQLRRISIPGPFASRVIWALPPVILEFDLIYFVREVVNLAKRGFVDWQISHIGQIQVFKEAAFILERDQARYQDKKVKGKRGKPKKRTKFQAGKGKKFTSFHLFGNHSLNIMNSMSLKTVRQADIKHTLIAQEVDSEVLRDICSKKDDYTVGMTVYGLPNLFVSRVDADFFDYDRQFVSPKNERFFLKKRFDHTIAISDRPFSLISYLSDLAATGVDYGVIDLSCFQFRKGELAKFWLELGLKKGKRQATSTFNYLGKLL